MQLQGVSKVYEQAVLEANHERSRAGSNCIGRSRTPSLAKATQIYDGDQVLFLTCSFHCAVEVAQPTLASGGMVFKGNPLATLS